MRAKALVIISLHSVQHGSIHGVNDSRRVAPRVVTTQHITPQTVAHKGFGGLEHLRLGAAKAVNALLGVAHNEHAGGSGPRCPTATAARARVAAKPRLERLPLQRVGVLKFVNQQMLDARVQPLLHPACQQRVAQHDLRSTFHIIHVNPIALALERAVLGNQQPGEARHALLVAPGRVLRPGRHHALHQVLRFTNALNAGNLFAKFAWRAGGGEQGVKGGINVARGQGRL